MPSALLGGRIYTPGGIDADRSAEVRMDVYDPATDRWTPAPPLPEARHHFGIAVAGGKLYVIGGYQPGPLPWAPSDAVFEFDPATQAWTRKAPMPAPRAAHVSVELGGRIYSIGGVSGGGAVPTTEVFDPAANSWAARAPMPTAREHLTAAVIGERILVVGGRTNRNLAALEAYTPSTNLWSELREMPTARGGLTAAALGGRLLVFGGESPGVFSATEEYDPTTNAWRRMADMLTPRHGMGAVAAGNTIYVIGGGSREGFGASAANEAFAIP
ncbi:MAG: kelch repeat-containing protein [Gemmatimonadaceae bacterium]